jgi:plastocyanin
MNRICLASCTLILGLLTFTVMKTVFAENTVVTIVNGSSKEAPLFANSSFSVAQTSEPFRAYYPSSTIEIKPNTTVIWHNNDTVPHTIKSSSTETPPGTLFDSGIIKEGISWNHTFTNVGEYGYFDSIYPEMRGKVVVGENISLTNMERNNNTIREHDNLSNFGSAIKGGG